LIAHPLNAIGVTTDIGDMPGGATRRRCGDESSNINLIAMLS
jgi:hypothetical protein